MNKITFSQSDCKEEILNECREVGNASIVVRRHDISRDTVLWMDKGQ